MDTYDFALDNKLDVVLCCGLSKRAERTKKKERER